MAAMIMDKRRVGDRIPGIHISNGLWFKCLDVEGMSSLIDTQHTNDPLNVTPAKAKKMGMILNSHIDEFNESTNERQWISYLIQFLNNCNGFRTC